MLLSLLSLAGALPAPSPAGGQEGREMRGGELKMSLWNGAEAVSEDSGGEGWAAMKSESQQRLQLNQFGDKNSACRPCFCSDFIKVSAALERKPACVSLPPLQTGERSKIATTTELLSSFIFSPFLCSLSPTLSLSPQKCLLAHLFSLFHN